MAAEIQLRAPSFEEMIQRRGMPVLWEKSQKCTCWDDYSGHPTSSCLACHGVGYLYDAPIETRNVLIMSLVINKDFTFAGEYRMGDAIATVPKRKYEKDENGLWHRPFNALFDIGEWDKITLVETEFRTHETLKLDTPLYGREADTLRNEAVTRVMSVLKANPETGNITYYAEGTDFTLDGNKLNWDSSANLETGETYSVLYYHRPVYIVYTQLPQSRDQDMQQLPKKVVLRYRSEI